MTIKHTVGGTRYEQHGEQGVYRPRPHKVCPVCLLISCDCTPAQVAEHLADEDLNRQDEALAAMVDYPDQVYR